MHTIMKRPLELSDFYLGEEIEDIIKPREAKENVIVPIVLPKGVKEEWKDIRHTPLKIFSRKYPLKVPIEKPP